METQTYYDGLKAKVRWNGSQWVWNIYAENGRLMAGGEEFKLHHAFEAAAQTTFAIRQWANTARGILVPSSNGGRWFSFEPTEALLTKRKKRGKVKK